MIEILAEIRRPNIDAHKFQIDKSINSLLGSEVYNYPDIWCTWVYRASTYKLCGSISLLYEPKNVQWPKKSQ